MQALQAATTAGSQVRVLEDDVRQVMEVVVVGVDRPGLLADLSGVLAAWGIAVESAYISTTADHWAVDTFVVRGGHPALQTPARQVRVIDEIKQAIQTVPAVADRLAERRRAAISGRTYTPRALTRVVFDLDAIDGATVVDIFAADREALLYDLTYALFTAGADIVLARITTEGDRAINAFYLVGAHSQARLQLAERLAVQAAISRVTSGAAGGHSAGSV
jgi:[protein-PII] uridylyltransferase